MNVESPAMTDPISSTPNAARRLFRSHVVALAITAALVVPLLLGTTSIPAWIAMTFCIIIAGVAIGFIVAAKEHARSKSGHNLFERYEPLILALALSMAQFIFTLPVLICVYAPTLRL
jgi:F0F1-type ATP synthase membrane subunit c/vacuolar-type H+-ATPase subunit K